MEGGMDGWKGMEKRQRDSKAEKSEKESKREKQNDLRREMEVESEGQRGEGDIHIEPRYALWITSINHIL